MGMPIKCPYCQQKSPPAAEKCHACFEPFPWHQELEKLRDEIKERESNRIRATTTLIDEVVAMTRGGPPVSLSAIKGFAASWLFPRTVIVLGSLLGVLLLGMQTHIMHGQSRLLSIQSEAARVDQMERMRDRWEKVSLLNAESKTPSRHQLSAADLQCDEMCDLRISQGLVNISGTKIETRDESRAQYVARMRIEGLSIQTNLFSETDRDDESRKERKAKYLKQHVYPRVALCGGGNADSERIALLIDALDISARVLRTEPRLRQIQFFVLQRRDDDLYPDDGGPNRIVLLNPDLTLRKFLSRFIVWYNDFVNLSNDLDAKCKTVAAKMAKEIEALDH